MPGTNATVLSMIEKKKGSQSALVKALENANSEVIKLDKK